ncbi:MAG: glycosyltransferase family 9 protein [Candidatus Omnitrophica bacterium]|nr:glycosyltransferase family 9 protein [Candidatus Omnitrophota bacterium]MBU1128560.1 glycosyltransferase family 9 protein [Candidatus Omnitrophota bacterium]MBU1656859.1 glycosyltransferase family 9 protein [Candidatus Omnitrophota bacterium]MBU1851729.1 glycosyltransferase family 9 protein [Candidatus Omnitrophota bacterium]
MKRFLIANIFGIGDVLFTTPLVANLKKEPGAATVDYLCNARTSSVIENDPDIDGVFVYEKNDYLKLWRMSKRDFFKSLCGLFFKIRRKRYDAVFDFTLSREFGFFFMLAGIPKRIGLDYKNRGIFLTHKRKLSGFEDKHVVEYYLDLLKYARVRVSIKETRLVPDKNTCGWAKGYLDAKGIRKEKFIVIAPGGGASWGKHASRKRWDARGFAQVSDILSAASGKIALLGDASERPLCEEVASCMRTAPVFIENGLNLKEYMALISMCDLVVCNDGGPLHIARALGVPTVSIFGPVDEKVYGPYPSSGDHKVVISHDLACRPCYNRFKLPECGNSNRCVVDIDPREVAEACMELLGRREARGYGQE